MDTTTIESAPEHAPFLQPLGHLIAMIKPGNERLAYFPRQTSVIELPLAYRLFIHPSEAK
jgi:hypothetical protein